jgi:hypothetical protein
VNLQCCNNDERIFSRQIKLNRLLFTIKISIGGLFGINGSLFRQLRKKREALVERAPSSPFVAGAAGQRSNSKSYLGRLNGLQRFLWPGIFF